MAWFDYKKAYDMVLQSGILNCLKKVFVIVLMPLKPIHRICTRGKKDQSPYVDG